MYLKEIILLFGTIKDVLGNRAILFSPLVIAAYPVSYLYAENAHQMYLADAMGTVTIVIIATVFITLLLRLPVEDDSKVAAIVTIILLLFYCMVPLHNLLKFGPGDLVSIEGVSIGRYRYLIPFSTAIALVGGIAIIRCRWNLVPMMKLVAILALVLILFNGGRAALGNRGETNEILFDGQALSEFPFPQTEPDKFPDIYYIITDSYGRADMLLKNYGFDNSEFIDSLTKKGFFVATESRSNYRSTSLSIGSSLSMRYLKENEKPKPLIRQNPVAQLLQRAGYKYLHINSGIYSTDFNEHADVQYYNFTIGSLLANEFIWNFVRLTALYPLAEAAGYDINTIFTPKWVTHFYDNLSRLREIPENPSPTFTFSHLHPPHAPMVFDREGNMPDNPGTHNSPLPKAEFDRKYIDQIFFINSRFESVIDDILERSSNEPIIILQGDHGPVNFEPDWSFTAERVLSKMPILNAIYLPEYCRSGLYHSMSPVNTFRTVLNSCLGTDFEILPDESYWDANGPPIDFSQFQR